MFTLRQIQSLEEPALAPYRTMRRPVEHVRQGIFVAEGEKVVRRMLHDTRIEVLSVLLPEKWLPVYEPLLRSHPQQLEVFTAETAFLEQMVGFHLYQGVLAVGRIPPPPTLETLLETSTRPRLFVAADGLSNSENVGVLVRNCAAFRAQALIVGETCASPWLRRSVRNSMGTLFQLPVIETNALTDTLQTLRAAGIRVIGAHPHTDQRTLRQADLTGDCCLVMGSEGDGISPDVLAVCDEAVAIPMPPAVDSLNVTSASAVFLYEASRQREQV
jgi:tRNA G18 (ribose-2'-O)-methylase SpoU